MSVQPKILALIAVFSLFAIIPAQASLLNHPDAFNDGNGPFGGAWTGSVPYTNGTLTGTIDFAVFTAANFNSNYGGLGYVPGDALVYTYQVNNTGTHFVSAEIVGIANPANTIGTFDIGDVDASSAALTPNAEWLFSPSIPTGQSSFGLAFSSPRAPMSGVARTVNNGSSDLSFGVPTPGPNNIPEPTTFALLLAGVGASMVLRRRDRS